MKLQITTIVATLALSTTMAMAQSAPGNFGGNSGVWEQQTETTSTTVCNRFGCGAGSTTTTTTETYTNTKNRDLSFDFEEGTKTTPGK